MLFLVKRIVLLFVFTYVAYKKDFKVVTVLRAKLDVVFTGPFKIPMSFIFFFCMKTISRLLLRF